MNDRTHPETNGFMNCVNEACGLLIDLIRLEGKTKKEVAENIGMNEQTFRSQINRNALEAQSFFDALHFLGFGIYIHKEDGFFIPAKNRPEREDVSQMVKRKTYRTRRSVFLCEETMEDGLIRELWLQGETDFFFVMRHEDEDPYVLPVSVEHAKKFFTEHEALAGISSALS